TLGGARAVAGQLPETVGTPLLAVAREAFTSGLVLASLISAAIAVLTAVLILGILRRAGTPDSEGEETLPATVA
ncbi:MFS transporter, partial [Nitratireductor sp. GCM10026969]